MHKRLILIFTFSVCLICHFYLCPLSASASFEESHIIYSAKFIPATEADIFEWAAERAGYQHLLNYSVYFIQENITDFRIMLLSFPAFCKKVINPLSNECTKDNSNNEIGIHKFLIGFLLVYTILDLKLKLLRFLYF